MYIDQPRLNSRYNKYYEQWTPFQIDLCVMLEFLHRDVLQMSILQTMTRI